eukprot:scaffold78387_cov99-Phaeocystis_antarctica.AAC.1
MTTVGGGYLICAVEDLLRRTHLSSLLTRPLRCAAAVAAAAQRSSTTMRDSDERVARAPPLI